MTKALKTILKLNDLTKNSEITWKTWEHSVNSLTGLERILGTAYIGKVDEKYFRIYKYESRHYYDEDVFEWVPHFRLEFIDGHGNQQWEFPEHNAVSDLYESIQFRISGASDFFDKFLEE